VKGCELKTFILTLIISHQSHPTPTPSPTPERERNPKFAKKIRLGRMRGYSHLSQKTKMTVDSDNLVS